MNETADNYRPLRIADLASDDRPREKALESGIKSLTNAELMAIILGGGIQGMSVIDLARTILHHNDNSLASIAGMSVSEMSAKYKGIGPAKAVALAAAFELGIRCRDEMARADNEITVIRSSSDIYNLMRSRLELCEREEFWVLMLSRSNRVKCKVCISQGGTAATVVDIKLVLKRAIDNLAESLVLIHNHPSGTLATSAEDDSLTKRITTGAEYLGMKVIDHVIITRNGFLSYHDTGKL